MRVMLFFVLMALSTLPVFGQPDDSRLPSEVVIGEEDPRWVIECAALMGKITIGDGDPAPLYVTLFQWLLGEDANEWDSKWGGFFVLLVNAAAECHGTSLAEMIARQNEVELTDSGELDDNRHEFNSAADGQEPLLGPITLAGGIYIVSLESDDFASAKFEAVSECDGEMAYGMSIYQDEGKVQERLDIESDCRLTIQVDARGDWTLSIEPL